MRCSCSRLEQRRFAYITTFNPVDLTGAVNVVDIDTRAVVATIPTGTGWGVAVSSDGTRVYTGDRLNPGAIHIIDGTTNTETGKIDLPGSRPYGLALPPSGAGLYVTDESSSRVLLIDTSLRADVHLRSAREAAGSAQPADAGARLPGPLRPTVEGQVGELSRGAERAAQLGWRVGCSILLAESNRGTTDTRPKLTARRRPRTCARRR